MGSEEEWEGNTRLLIEEEKESTEEKHVFEGHVSILLHS